MKGTKKGKAPIEWSGQSETSFRESKRALANVTILAHSIPGASNGFAMDASDYALGAVPQQYVIETWQPSYKTLELRTAKV